ncbi:phospholipase D/nuclease [Basidiobolus meristosporus CBS 931.73]|uniref:phospholipase D n=1 Tax=Basidiobolus meristosporus CBS 931.73 TaxID=1314790 RepID=A0A1Y1Z7S2_9FUNG|nr:phospholipase D/nuclease [Basidiobolus meristosporus CBS 931.73]|eukprot:ORY06329.1 phospholipase D/nuclease [Basidiobolus meristosporus CBS 931.73]
MSKDKNRYDSFAPERYGAKARWFVDGKDYFYAVSEALLQAKETIFIMDWWLSPEVYLRRPPSENQEFRLDRLLTKKAKEGVIINIIVYKEVSMALTINSHHTKFTLQALHPNITVQRHPDHGAGGTVFWAHHEKVCLVDSKIAFLGGMDLCYGRYDTHSHRLADYHYDPADNVWPGQDYSNPRVKDFSDVSQYYQELINRKCVARMPWHDVALCVTGPPIEDIESHFVDRWNFIKKEKGMHRKNMTFLSCMYKERNSGSEGSCKVQVLRSCGQWSGGTETEQSIYTAYVENIRNARHFIYIENQFFVSSAADSANNEVKNKIAQALVERIIRARQENTKFRVIVVMPLLPAFEREVNASDANTIRLVMDWQYRTIGRGGSSILERLQAAGINASDYISFYGLRSHDMIKNPYSESSCEETSRRFDCLSPGSSDDSENSFTTPNYVTRHEVIPPSPHSNVIVIHDVYLPFAFPQSVQEKQDVDPQTSNIVTNYAYREGDFVTELTYVHSKLMIVDDRIVICGSANINDRSMRGNRDSEIAVIIEDQEKVPSMMNGQQYEASKFAYELRCSIFKEHLGLLEDGVDESLQSQYPESSPLAPLPDQSSTCLHSLRSRIHRHLHNRPSPPRLPDVTDPLSDRFFNDVWDKTASTNTAIYRLVFRCIPDDMVTNWTQYAGFVPDTKLVQTGHCALRTKSNEEIKLILSSIRGNLVSFPTKFLQEETLNASALSREAFAPLGIFT